MEQLLPELVTSRLILVPPQPGEEAALADALNTSLADLGPWLAFARAPSTVDELRAVIAAAREAIGAGRILQWRLWSASRDQMLGSIDVHGIDWSVPKGEVGYWLRSSAVGQGFVAEAVHRAVRYVFEERGFARLEARCDTRNLRAQHVVERLGFTREGVAQSDDRDVEGSLADTVVYGIYSAGELRALAV